MGFQTAFILTIPVMPSGIFALMEEKLRLEDKYAILPQRIRKNFFVLRSYYGCKAWDECRDNVKDEITLADIYEIFQKQEALADNEVQLLVELEKQTEYDNIIGIPENIKKIYELKEAGKQIALISNMYLSAEFVKKMLEKVDAVFHDIRLYVSSEYGQRKDTQKLYQIVHNEEKANYLKWVLAVL